MAIQSNFPAIKPTLLLDFSNTEQLDPRITFTRASTGTYYDGKTVAKAEENLLIRSQEFDNAAWNKENSTATSNTTAAPDGTTTADTVTENASLAWHGVSQTVSVVAGLTYTYTCFAKAGTRQYVYLQLADAVVRKRFAALFDLSTGTFVTSNNVGSPTGTSYSITSVGNSWYRLSVSMTAATGGSGAVLVGISNTSTPSWSGSSLIEYTGDGTSGIFVWGAQVEQRSSVTAYTATTTQPITNYIPQLLTAASGVARFEHNPITGESLGLEIEESRTNLLTYSEQFDNAAWLKLNATVTANAVVAPDGTLTGDKWFEDTANSAHQLQQPSTYTSGTTYTYSFYAKKGERSIITMYENILQGIEYAKFNLNTGVATNLGVPIGWTRNAISMSPVGNGWYRCVVTATPGSNVTNSAFITRMRLDNGTTTTYTGDGYSGIYIWGAQLEAGAFPTSYIPTVASQVTRAADAASMTGTNFSSWYNQAEGTLYAEAAAPLWSANAVALAPALASINDGTSSNRIYLGRSAASTRPFFNVIAGGVTQADITTSLTSWAGGSAMKLAGAYKANDLALCTDGGAAGTDTVGTLPVVTQLLIGSRGDGPIWNSTIKKLAYYPALVTNAQSQALTS